MRSEHIRSFEPLGKALRVSMKLAKKPGLSLCVAYVSVSYRDIRVGLANSSSRVGGDPAFTVG